jgi:hypothetical protein
VLALIGLEIDRLVRAVCDFEAQILGGEAHGAIEIRGAEADIGDVLQLDHVRDLPLRFSRVSDLDRWKND